MWRKVGRDNGWADGNSHSRDRYPAGPAAAGAVTACDCAMPREAPYLRLYPRYSGWPSSSLAAYFGTKQFAGYTQVKVVRLRLHLQALLDYMTTIVKFQTLGFRFIERFGKSIPIYLST